MIQQYRIRKLEDSDKALLQKWINQEPYHIDVPVTTYTRSDSHSMVIYDSGGPIAFLQLTPYPGHFLWLWVQFDQNQSLRTAKGFPQVIRFIKQVAKKQGFSEIRFNSKAGHLVRFCKKHFGVQDTEFPNEYKMGV